MDKYVLMTGCKRVIFDKVNALLLKKRISFIIVFVFFSSPYSVFSQENKKIIPEVSQLFIEQSVLPIKLAYSINYIKKNTNDTTYINSSLSYKLKEDSWQDIEILLRARGNFRLDNCYFPPLKIKLKKKIAKYTIFEGNKSLKLVLPCLQEKDNNDNVIKEYLAYKLFEIVSPYHFKTRLTDITFEEEKRKKTITHKIKGFLIEDDKTVAKRLNGNVYKGKVHPLGQETKACVRNAFFQFMIGNTDFSQAYSHNVKLLFIDKKMVPIPYDFDMAGLVNTSYSFVSEIPGDTEVRKSVTQRKYRGFERDKNVFAEVRQEFIDRKSEIMLLFDKHIYLFENPKECKEAKEYLLSFFEILENNKRYTNEIVHQARTK